MSQVPFVTIIMPIRNEADYIDRSLGSILAQNYPSDCLEVLVVFVNRKVTQLAVEKLPT